MDKDKDCTIPDDKVNLYFLKPGAKHSEDFFRVGYKSTDAEKLKKDITANFDYRKAVDKIITDGSEKFSIFMDLGVTQRKRFRTVWKKDTSESVPRIITAYRED